MARLEYKASPTVGNSETHRIHFETGGCHFGRSLRRNRGWDSCHIEGICVFACLCIYVFVYLCICVFVCHLGSWRRRNRGWVCPIETGLLPLLLFDLLEKYNRESLKDWLVPIENRLALVKWDFSGRQGGKDI